MVSNDSHVTDEQAGFTITVIKKNIAKGTDVHVVFQDFPIL